MQDEDSGPGADDWASSPYHVRSTRSSSVSDTRAVYARWASTYDHEMRANDLQSYKSVVRKALTLGDWPETTETLRVMDAGCGTGLLGQHFIAQTRGRCSVHLTGIDLSLEMLQLAKQKKCYDQLVEADLKEALPFAESSFDLILSSGVFLAGHCGVESTRPMLRPLRAGGHAVFTVRSSLYQDDEAMFLTAIHAAGCECLQAVTMPYYGDIRAHVVVVKKRHPSYPWR